MSKIMSIDDDRDRLYQEKMLDSLTRSLTITEMLTVYCTDTAVAHNYRIYCALIPNNQIAQIIAKPTWDLSHGHGIPGSVIYHEGEEERVKYLRFGDENGIEPLVIVRDFHGMRKNYKEIAEEFRLFHGLYHDKKADQFVKFDDDGNETVVAIVEENRVQIRVKEILQFLAIREMHLSIQFDCREHSVHSLEELGLKEGGTDQQNGQISWRLGYGDFCGIGEFRAFSRLLGKRLFKPLSKSKSGFWGFAQEEEKKYADFIIEVSDDGDERSYTSAPDALANNFDAKSEAPNYLTPVHFSKQVLDKYYHQPSKYSVEDSMLRCGNLWSLQMDNHHQDKVCVWLGDLGRDLPYLEQLHWKTYNIPPQGCVSETYFKRQILVQFTNSDRPEHAFANLYRYLHEECERSLGWQLLLPLSPGDEHSLKCMRIPATDEQRDFDELVLGLTKLLIDSLNEKELNRLISKDNFPKVNGSISRLETALAGKGVADAGTHIAFLRKLQELRSSSSAHRKGSNYDKIANAFGVGSQNLRSVFAGIVNQALAFLGFLVAVVQDGKLKKC